MPPKEPAHFKPYKHPYGPPPGVDKGPGEEYYSPAGGYPPHDVGGENYLRPSSRLLEPPIQSPYGQPDPGGYRKPVGPQVINGVVKFELCSLKDGWTVLSFSVYSYTIIIFQLASL